MAQNFFVSNISDSAEKAQSASSTQEDRPYDVFISYKNTTPTGTTIDREIAEKLHAKLSAAGLKVFFSEKDLSNAAFMKEIYKALEEADLLILVASSLQNINSRWVESEWATFFGSIQSGRKANSSIITVLKDITTKEIPIQLEHFQSFSADNLDGAVDFALRVLGKSQKREAVNQAADLRSPQPQKTKKGFGLFDSIRKSSVHSNNPLGKITAFFSGLLAHKSKLLVVASCLFSFVMMVLSIFLLTCGGAVEISLGGQTFYSDEILLDLSGCGISDISKLSRCSNLESLDINGFFNGSFDEDGTHTAKNNITDLSPISKLRRLTDISADDNQISDLTPLSNLQRLNYLSLVNNEIQDVAPLSSLSDLKHLILAGNNIEDISPLSECDSLAILDLDRNNIYSIETLGELDNLTDLSLSENWIDDLTALSDLHSLYYLSIGNNEIVDLSPIRDLYNLENLSLNNNNIINISPIFNLTALMYLDLSYNEIFDIFSLSNLYSLRTLIVSNNNITDITPLSRLANLDYVDASGNEITDISPLRHLIELSYLDLCYNNISDISPLSALVALEDLQLYNNEISDISALASLTDLGSLQLQANKISDVSHLASLENLYYLDLSQNSISDVASLTGLSNLTDLLLEENSIHDISPLCSLTSLTKLYLRGNNIEDLSPLYYFINLEYLTLDSEDYSADQKNELHQYLPNCEIVWC